MKAALRNRLMKALNKHGLTDSDFAHASWCPNGIALTTEGRNAHLVGNYWLAGETCHGGLYDDFGVNEDLNAILAKHKCFAEWHNAAVLCVVEV